MCWVVCADWTGASVRRMRLTWAQHLQAARTLQLHGDADVGGSLCLMGMALLMLSEDLLELEIQRQCVVSDH